MMVMVVNRIKMVMVVIVNSMIMSIIGVLVFYFALSLHHSLLLGNMGRGLVQSVKDEGVKSIQVVLRDIDSVRNIQGRD